MSVQLFSSQACVVASRSTGSAVVPSFVTDVGVAGSAVDAEVMSAVVEGGVVDESVVDEAVDDADASFVGALLEVGDGVTTT
jgi:hypothetical protein